MLLINKKNRDIFKNVSGKNRNFTLLIVFYIKYIFFFFYIGV